MTDVVRSMQSGGGDEDIDVSAEGSAEVVSGDLPVDGDTGEAPTRWLLISVSLSAGQASLRVHVWRKLRSLGSVYLQSSVCLLPERPAVLREVRRLLDRVHHEGGASRLLHITITDPGESAALQAEFDDARDVEYGEVLERVPELAREISTERARGRATYAEVEESEADLDRFHAWLAKIEARDYFAAPGGPPARAAVAAVAEQLAAFEAEALNAEAPEPARGLRAVPGRAPKPRTGGTR